MIKEYKHIQTSHCENGAIVNLLNDKGFELSEAMAFGIGSGLFFGYLPFIKPNGSPLTTFRIYPGHITENIAKRLGVKIKQQKFKQAQKSMNMLDYLLDRNIAVALITNVFYLPYFPESYRFHYNMHNMVVYGKQGNDYLVSDPVIEDTTKISYKDLIRARYSYGGKTIKGDMYYITDISNKIDIKNAIIKGIRATSTDMLKRMIPYNGVSGMRYLSRKIRKWNSMYDEETRIKYLGNLIRMQEEVGTGGAGFRYIYAAFLQEAAEILQKPELNQQSDLMTDVGDLWREFAYKAGNICKGRDDSKDNFIELSDILNQCADREERIYKKLKQMFI